MGVGLLGRRPKPRCRKRNAAMMLTELTTVSGAALPVQGLKDHLRLGTGFAHVWPVVGAGYDHIR